MKNEKQIKALLKEAYNSNDVCDKWKNKILEVYPKAKENVLEVGKWYKCIEQGTLWYIKEVLENGLGSGYGFLFGEWDSNCDTILINKDNFKWKKATEEEVKQALINEAEKRGFKKGSYCAFGELGTYKRHLVTSSVKMHKDYTGYYLVVLNDEDKGNDIIFRDGKWVEIVKETITKEEAEKQLGKIITC